MFMVCCNNNYNYFKNFTFKKGISMHGSGQTRNTSSGQECGPITVLVINSEQKNTKNVLAVYKLRMWHDLDCTLVRTLGSFPGCGQLLHVESVPKLGNLLGTRADKLVYKPGTDIWQAVLMTIHGLQQFIQSMVSLPCILTETSALKVITSIVIPPWTALLLLLLL